jgi:hypothetical protein
MPNKDNQPASVGYTSAVRFLKGGLSGFTSGALLQPLQVIKTSMQVSPIGEKRHRHMSFMEATRVIYQSEGMKGFLRGLLPSLLKSTLTSGTYFSTLYYFEERLKKI